MANQVVPKNFYKSYYLYELTLSLNFKLQKSKLTKCTSCDFQLIMVYLSTCALVFFWIAATHSGESLASEQATFKRSEQKYLGDHVIETKQADSELECGSHCIADKSCTSINYKTSGIGKGRCELNNKTAEEPSSVDDKKHDPEFNHLALIKRVVSLQLKIYFIFRGCCIVLR